MSTRRWRRRDGLARAFAKLKALNPIWAHDSVGALEWLKDGQAVMATALNGDVANLKGFTPGVIWDHQLYEMDVFGIPAGDPNKDWRWIISPTPPAARRWRAWRAGCLSGPARRSALALVKANPETGQAMRPAAHRAISATPSRWMMAGGWRMARRSHRAGRRSSGAQ